MLVKEFQERVLEMMLLRRPFAVATVIGVSRAESNVSLRKETWSKMNDDVAIGV
jgi:hypothetical protein